VKKENETKQLILIVDDSEMNRAILTEMLGNEYRLLEAENGSQAIALLNKYSSEISLVLLDIVMPIMDGYDVLAVMNSKQWIEDIPVIMISSENSQTHIERAYDLGVTDFIGRPFDALVVRRRVINTLMLYTKQRKLTEMVAEQIFDKEKSNNIMINILSHIVEFRNGESGLHILHVQCITEILIKRLMQITSKYDLSASDITRISTAAALHDIGKITIPDEILNKPGRLTDEEFEIMKTHSAAGAAMLDDIALYRDEPLVKTAHEICRWHHERYDGRGYPDGLKGDEIPISAQIVALADVYDALTSDRVYKKAFSHEKALQMILNGECGTFNPLILECLKDAADTLKKEVKIKSLTKNKEREKKNISAEILEHNELSRTKRALNQLEYERIKLNFLMSVTQAILFEYTTDPPMIILSPYGADVLGMEEVSTQCFKDSNGNQVISEEDLKKLHELVYSTTPEQYAINFFCKIRVKGVFKDAKFVCRVIRSGENEDVVAGVIGKIIFVQEESGETRIENKILPHDKLTGLLTYNYAKRLMQKIISENSNSNFAMAIIDIDGFKDANRSRGYDFGNELLMHIAERLRRIVGGDDVVSRVGGDEFVIFMERRENPDNEIKGIFSKLKSESGMYPFSVCMGVSESSVDTANCATLFGQANRALYTAKKSGDTQLKFYDDSMRDMLSAISPIKEKEREIIV
jgi:putative two-component system response regulator